MTAAVRLWRCPLTGAAADDRKALSVALNMQVLQLLVPSAAVTLLLLLLIRQRSQKRYWE